MKASIKYSNSSVIQQHQNPALKLKCVHDVMCPEVLHKLCVSALFAKVFQKASHETQNIPRKSPRPVVEV